MITKFEALVAREELADVFFIRTGEAVTVTAIRESVPGAFLVEIEYSNGDRYTYPPSALEAGNGISELLRQGIYNEESMTHKGYGGMVTPLSY